MQSPVETDEGPLEGWLRALDKNITEAIKHKMDIALGLGQSLCPTLRLLWPRTLGDGKPKPKPRRVSPEREKKSSNVILNVLDSRMVLQRTTAQIPSQCIFIASDILFFRALTSTTQLGGNTDMNDVVMQCNQRIDKLLKVMRVRVNVHKLGFRFRFGFGFELGFAFGVGLGLGSGLWFAGSGWG